MLKSRFVPATSVSTHACAQSADAFFPAANIFCDFICFACSSASSWILQQVFMLQTFKKVIYCTYSVKNCDLILINIGKAFLPVSTARNFHVQLPLTFKTTSQLNQRYFCTIVDRLYGSKTALNGL